MALVYDLLDTEGTELPEDVFRFVVRANIDDRTIKFYIERLKRKGIESVWKGFPPGWLK